MSFAELFVLAVGLSMDALAVSICKGLSQPALTARHLIVTADAPAGLAPGRPV